MFYIPKGRIFIIDNEPTMATLASELQMNGFSASFFTSVIEALEAAQVYESDSRITDVVMPDLSGVDLAISLSAQFSEMKILMFSGESTTWRLLERALNLSYPFDLPVKAVHPAVLLSRETTAFRQPFRPETRVSRREGAGMLRGGRSSRISQSSIPVSPAQLA